MEGAPRRRFTLLDGMILVAASAAGLALYRAWPPGWIANDLDEVVRGIACTLFVLSLTVPLLALRRPRPDLRLVARQPGVVAGLAVWVSVAFAVLNFSDEIVQMTVGAPHLTWQGLRDLILMGLLVPISNASAVGLAWVILALSGSWRADRGWVDRLGRVVGVAWLLLFAGRLAYQCVRIVLGSV